MKFDFVILKFHVALWGSGVVRVRILHENSMTFVVTERGYRLTSALRANNSYSAGKEKILTLFSLVKIGN